MTDLDLVAEYRELHRRGKFDGHSMLPHKHKIGELVRRHGARTLLDYGCGKGHQYTRWHAHMAWGGIMPTLYDIGVPEFAARPTGMFDGVICTDVAEHVPPENVDAFLADVIGFAGQFVFINVCCKPAVKNLPLSGRNAHLTVEPPDWWLPRIRAANRTGVDVVTEFET